MEGTEKENLNLLNQNLPGGAEEGKLKHGQLLSGVTLETAAPSGRAV